MNPSTFPGFQGDEEAFDYEALWSFEPSNQPSNPPQTSQQQLAPPHEQIQCFDQHSRPYLQSSTDMQNHITDPIQLQIQAQIAAQAQLQLQPSMLEQSSQPQSKLQNEHMQQSTPQSAIQHEIQKLQAQIEILRPKADIQQSRNQSQQIGQQSVCAASGLLPDLQPLGPENPKNSTSNKNNHIQQASNNALVQPNQPAKQPTDNSFDSDLPLSVVKQNLRNSNAPLRAGSASNVDNSNAMMFGRSEGQVKCPACDNLFTDSYAMRQHFRMIHASTDVKKNICQECIQPCDSGVSLRRHWNSAHVGELAFVCDLCGARFSKHRNLSFHRTKLHNLPGRPKPLTKRVRTKMHKCKLCDFTSPQKHNVVIHFSGVHTDEVGLDCPCGCGRSFESAVDAQVHFFNYTH